MAKVELKQPVVQAIVNDIEGAQSIVLVDYRGLTVAEDTALRKQLREAGVVYKVCKNTMMKRAFEGTDFAQLDEHLDGPNAIAISKDDATAPARILAKFAKDAKALELKAGVVEGQMYDASSIGRTCKDPFKRRTAFKITWKYAVSDHKPGTRSQPDRRKRWSSRMHTGYRRSSCRGSSRDSGYRGVRSMRKSCVTSEYKVLCA